MDMIQYTDNKDSMVTKLVKYAYRYASDWIVQNIDTTIAALLNDCVAEGSHWRGQPLPSICSHLEDLIKKVVSDNMPTPEPAAYVMYASIAVIGVCTVYCIGVLFLTLYCCPRIHSQSKKLLAGGELTDHKLDVFIGQEMNPLLEPIEIKLSKGKEEDEKNRQIIAEMMKILKEKIDKIQNILNDIKNQRNQATEGDGKCTSLQISLMAAASVATGCFIIAAAALGMEAFYAGTLILFTVSMIGVVGTGYTSKEAKKNYQKSLKIIHEMESRAREAEKVLTALHTKVQIENLKT